MPGCRVRVRFAGRLTGGYLLERADASDHPGTLAFLERVVSPEPVLTAEIADLARAVADRYGGTLADVLRLAIPPRHARAEAAGREAAGPEKAGPEKAGPEGADPEAAGPDGAPPARPAAGDPGPWARYPAGPSFLAALADGRSPRAVWSALPGPDWPDEIARAAAATAAAGRGALIVVPDGRDLDGVDAALTAILGAGSHVCLSADLGPAERYRRWLTVLRGGTRIVAGTRSAMFAPVAALGLVVLWDDGDDLHAEPRAPYPHAREVLAIRAHRRGAAALIGGFARTAEATQLVAGGWAHALGGDRAAVRRRAPLITAAGDDGELARDQAARWARMPGIALRTARDALARGPVLFQVPRRGYLVAVACERCHARAQCAACGGPLALPAPQAAAFCRWCAVPAAGRKCPQCGHTGLRALVTGAGRTAEELGRAFPSLPVRTSGRTEVITEVSVLAGGGRRHARRGAAGRGRLRGRRPARWLDAARAAQPARRRGGAAPLDERGGAGPAGPAAAR